MSLVHLLHQEVMLVWLLVITAASYARLHIKLLGSQQLKGGAGKSTHRHNELQHQADKQHYLMILS